MAEPGTTVDIDAQLLRAWPLPQSDGGADKEERGSTLVIAGSAEMPGAAALAATTPVPGARSPSGSARSATSPASCRARSRPCWTSSPIDGGRP